MADVAHDLLPDRRLHPLMCPPFGILPAPRRARVKGVSGARHGEVGGLPVVSPDFAFTIIAIRGRHRWAPPRVVGPIVATFSFKMHPEGSGLRRLIKVCFSVLRMSPRSQSVRSNFTTTGSKAAVTAKSLMLKNDRMVSLRSRLPHRGFALIMVRIRTV